ncbi:tetratricopeptide repeat protein [Candidatus Pacearchaeota archaeon]|jgi:tetratricopeptide (TPR) repeat protein|nr:tetratricopeptide repeat protein [Candidatus Pacearchaeota archaeon]
MRRFNLLVFVVTSIAFATFAASDSITQSEATRKYQEGVYLYDQGDLDGAIEAWKETLKLKPESIPTRDRLIEALEKKNITLQKQLENALIKLSDNTIQESNTIVVRSTESPSVVTIPQTNNLSNSNWSSRVEKAIADHIIIMGMTAEQVKASWGNPDQINRDVSKYGESEQWVYGDQYIYLENGIVDYWQESEKP